MSAPAMARLLAALERDVASRGWGQPAGLYAIERRGGDTEAVLAAQPVVALGGNPVCELLRLRLRLDPVVLGAAVVTEAWAYGPDATALIERGERPGFTPAHDPARVELRLAQLCLRDGSTRVIEHRRGENSAVLAGGGGWIDWMLRLSLAIPSRAHPPESDLALRLVMVWQLSNLLALTDGGFDLEQLSVRDEEWGRFALPGLGEVPGGVRDPWWGVVEAALETGRLDVGAFAAALRDQMAHVTPDALGAGVCLPLAFPFERGEDHVMADRELTEYLDDDALVAFVDDSVPTRDVLAAGARRSLPRRLDAGAQRRLAQG